jgi:Raf kinase inhibitor-like YbhB/YbcL family protein
MNYQRTLPVAAIVATFVLSIGCQNGSSASAGSSTGASATKISVTSSAFQASSAIPKQYTGDGADRSPPLAWSGVPAGTKELALICDDPDAPTAEPWVHWVLYKIPAETKSLGEGIPRQAKLPAPAGAVQGENSFPTDNIGYRGPAPPKGKLHHYHFHIFALDTTLPSTPGLDKEKLLTAIKGHAVAEGELIGTYER